MGAQKAVRWKWVLPKCIKWGRRTARAYPPSSKIKKGREENYREIEREKERLREREKNGWDATNFENHGPDHYKRDGEKDRYRKSEMVKDR